MRINYTNQQLFKGISTNSLPRLREDKNRELEYIKNKYEIDNNAKRRV